MGNGEAQTPHFRWVFFTQDACAHRKKSLHESFSEAKTDRHLTAAKTHWLAHFYSHWPWSKLRHTNTTHIFYKIWSLNSFLIFFSSHMLIVALFFMHVNVETSAVSYLATQSSERMPGKIAVALLITCIVQIRAFMLERLAFAVRVWWASNQGISIFTLLLHRPQYSYFFSSQLRNEALFDAISRKSLVWCSKVTLRDGDKQVRKCIKS